MKKVFTAPVVLAFVGATLLAACGDEEPSKNDNTGGKGASGGTGNGGTSGGTAGSSAGGTPNGGTSGATAGVAGTPAGGAGGRGGAGGAAGMPGGAGGAAGMPGGAGGAGGAAGAGGAGGAGGGSGGMMCKSPLPMGGGAGMAGAGGAGAGGGGAGGAGAGAGGAGAGGAGAGGAGAGGAGAGGAGAGGAGAGGAGAGGAGAGGGSAVAPRVVSTFDTPGSLTVAMLGSWVAGTYMPVPDTVVSRNMTEGVSCAGSAQLTIPFTAYGTQQDVQINFSPVQNWTGYRTLHAKVKVVMPSSGNLNHLNGIQLAVNSTTMYNTFKGHFYTPATFMDFGWHDLDLDLTTANPALVFAEVIQVQVQVQTQAMAPAMGPAMPVSTTILVDDVWVE